MPRRFRPLTCIAVFLVLTAYLGVTAIRVQEPMAGLMAHRYYPLFAESLAAGKITMPVEPAPELLALPDPYDHIANMPYRAQDLSLYGKHYYLFHGPSPAILLFLPFKLVTGKMLFQSAAVALLCIVGFFASLAILFRVQTRFGTSVAPWKEAIGVLLLGFCSGAFTFVCQPEVYQVAGAMTYASLMMALWALLEAAENPRRRILFLAAASCAAAAALGARPNSLFFCFVIPALALWWGLRERRAASYVAAASIPLGVTGILWLLYNAVRFDHALDFGQHYQLFCASLRHATLFSPKFLPDNTWHYLFDSTLPHLTAQFPFLEVKASSVLEWLPDGFHVVEPRLSLFAGMPIFLALMLWPAQWKQLPDSLKPWLVAALAGAALNLSFLLFYNTAALRYMTDFQAPLMLLAVIAFLMPLKNGSRILRIFHIFLAGAALYSVVITVLFVLQLGQWSLPI